MLLEVTHEHAEELSEVGDINRVGVHGVLDELVRHVEESSSNNVVSTNGKGVVEDVDGEEGGVVNGGVLDGGASEDGLVSGETVGVLDVEETDKSRGRLLEGLSRKPATGGEEEGEEEEMELLVLGLNTAHSSIVSLVVHHGDLERNATDTSGEEEVGNDPGDLEEAEEVTNPGDTTVSEEVGTDVRGRVVIVLGLDGSLNGGVASVDGGEEARGDLDDLSGVSPEERESAIEGIAGGSGEVEHGAHKGHDEGGGELILSKGIVDEVELLGEVGPGHAVVEHAEVVVGLSSLGALAGLADGGTVSAALRVGLAIKVKFLHALDEGE